MRPERHDRRKPARGPRRIKDLAVAQVDAVEATDRNGPLRSGKLLRPAGDLHSRASASSGGMKRSGSASSTEKGPISVRRSVLQWPPSTSAIART